MFKVASSSDYTLCYKICNIQYAYARMLKWNSRSRHFVNTRCLMSLMYFLETFKKKKKKDNMDITSCSCNGLPTLLILSHSQPTAQPVTCFGAHRSSKHHRLVLPILPMGVLKSQKTKWNYKDTLLCPHLGTKPSLPESTGCLQRCTSVCCP